VSDDRAVRYRDTLLELSKAHGLKFVLNPGGTATVRVMHPIRGDSLEFKFVIR
jgi:hypothetical protein